MFPNKDIPRIGEFSSAVKRGAFRESVVFAVVVACAWHLLYIRLHKTCNDGNSSRAVALVHAVAATVLHSYLWLSTKGLASSTQLCVPVEAARLAFATSWGYFAWDLFISVKENWGVPFILHAVLCLYVYGICTFTPFDHKHAIACMLYESSSIFLNLQGILKAKMKDQTRRSASFVEVAVFKLTQLAFALTFLFSRLVFGSWITYDMWRTYFLPEAEGCISLPLKVGILVINCAFHALNIYWFGKIVDTALRQKKRITAPSSITEESHYKVK